MKVKITRIHFVEIDNIIKIENNSKGVRVYLREGYPKVLKCNTSFEQLLLRMVNIGVNGKRIQEFIDQ